MTDDRFYERAGPFTRAEIADRIGANGPNCVITHAMIGKRVGGYPARPKKSESGEEQD
ncbi:MAG: hypothetical protein ABI608_09430 [Rhizomicrobium sp.]